MMNAFICIAEFYPILLAYFILSNLCAHLFFFQLIEYINIKKLKLKMIAGGKHCLHIQNCSRHIDFPFDPMARLMYYLNCVNSLIDFGIPSKLREYDSRFSISFDDENTVLKLSFLLKPSIFVQYGVMINDPSLCINSNNTIYKITDINCTFAVTKDFAIAGKQVHVSHVMAFKSIWKDKIYDEPMRLFTKRINAIRNGRVEEMRPKPKPKYSPSQASKHYNYQSPKSNKYQYYRYNETSKRTPSQIHYHSNITSTKRSPSQASKYNYKYCEKNHLSSQIHKSSPYKTSNYYKDYSSKYKSKYDDDYDASTSSDSHDHLPNINKNHGSKYNYKYDDKKRPLTQMNKRPPSPIIKSSKNKDIKYDNHLNKNDKYSTNQKYKIQQKSTPKISNCRFQSVVLVDIKPKVTEEKSEPTQDVSEIETKAHSKSCLLI